MKLRSRIALAILVAATALSAAPSWAAGGTLDRSFDGDGVSTVLNMGAEDQTRAIVVRPDGRIVVGATRFAWDSKSRRAHDDIALARYNANGSVDRMFSGDGKLVTDLGHIELTIGVASDPAGGIAVAGLQYDDAGTHPRVFVLHYTASGARDTHFGTAGVVWPFSSFEVPNGFQSVAGIVALPDGSFVVGGTIGTIVTPPALNAPVPTNQRCVAQFALMRLDHTGAQDPTFGAGGIALNPIDGACNVMDALTRQPDGALVAVGTRSADVASGLLAERFTAQGLPDPAFGTLGRTIVASTEGWAGARAVALQPNGGIVIAGVVTNTAFFDFEDHMRLWRLTPAGALDASFGSNGLVRPGFDGRIGGVVVRRTGAIVVAGEEGGCFLFFCDWHPLTFTIRPGGSLDHGYGIKGRVPFPTSFTDATAIALQGDRPVVGGNWHVSCSTCAIFSFGLADRWPADVAVARLTG